jgi:hypothetical protein
MPDRFAVFRRVLEEYLLDRGGQGQRDLADAMVRIGYPRPNLAQQHISYWLRNPSNLLKSIEEAPGTTRLDWVIWALSLSEDEQERLAIALALGRDRNLPLPFNR